MRCMWSGENPPVTCLEAELCLLYNGNKEDPNSLVVLLGVTEKYQRGQPQQNSFVTWQAIPGRGLTAVANDSSYFFCQVHTRTRVDFSKAFDSNHCSTAWQILEGQCMLRQIVDVVRRLYDTTSVAVRLSAEGPNIPTGKIRRLFNVPVLDRAMRGHTDACRRLWLHTDACWLGYVYNLVFMFTDESGAQRTLVQLQAACACVSLQVHVAET